MYCGKDILNSEEYLFDNSFIICKDCSDYVSPKTLKENFYGDSKALEEIEHKNVDFIVDQNNFG